MATTVPWLLPRTTTVPMAISTLRASRRAFPAAAVSGQHCMSSMASARPGCAALTVWQKVAPRQTLSQRRGMWSAESKQTDVNDMPFVTDNSMLEEQKDDKIEALDDKIEEKKDDKIEDSKDSSPNIRFFDSREKYLVFCTTTSEKWRVGERIIKELEKLTPVPPSINIFDAGLGDAAVLCRVLRGVHGRFPTVPIVTVGKEISQEDLRQALTKMPDRLAEHPQMVLCVTNMSYKAAPGLMPLGPKGKEDLNWIDFPLKGNTAIDFERQVEDKIREIEDMGAWDVKHTAAGNPVPAKPAVLVMYREDQRFGLDGVRPRLENGVIQNAPQNYDLIVASQPFRSRANAQSKCKNVVLPLMQALKPAGRMLVIQSTGHDPAMEIIRGAWPNEEPFATPGHVLQAELLRQLQNPATSLRKSNATFGLEASDFEFSSGDQFRYELHSLPDEATESIGSSGLLAAWNAAAYVAQMEDWRSDKVVQEGKFQKYVRNVIDKYGRLWFTNEAFVISRKSHTTAK